MTSSPVPIVRKLLSSKRLGVVVSAGRMDRAVKVRIAAQEWNKRFRKHFPSEETHLVADPNNSLVEGDVVRIASGWRTSKHIRHVVDSIVAPFGEPVENRPPVLSEEERMDIRIRERLMKDVRSAAKGRQISAQRLAQARKQKIAIPSLEEAMANVRLAEEAQKEEEEEGAGSPAQSPTGETDQALSNKQRRKQAAKEARQEKAWKQSLKETAAQAV